jgi:hypothetical protein
MWTGWAELRDKGFQDPPPALFPPLSIGMGQLTFEEERTQLTLWALHAAPLFFTVHPDKLPADRLALLLNPDWLGIARDRERRPGQLQERNARSAIWVRPLAAKRRAVGLFNLSERPVSLNVLFQRWGWGQKMRVFQVWKREDWEVVEAGFAQRVEPHGAVLFRLQPLR